VSENLFNIREFETGKILPFEEFNASRRKLSKEYSTKSYLDGRYVVCFDGTKDQVLVHDIATSYRSKFNDGALLIFIQRNNDASLVCFIDSTNTFVKDRVLIQEINIKKYENDYRKMEETILHFTTKQKRKIKVFLSDVDEDNDSLEMLNKIFNDFIICKKEDLAAFFPLHTLSSKKKKAYILKSLLFFVSSLLVSNFLFSSMLESLVEQDKKDLSKLSQERFALQNEKDRLSSDYFIVNEEIIVNTVIKEIAR